MHGNLDGRLLITHLAVQCSDDTLKSVLFLYMEKTRGSREDGNFPGLLQLVDKEFAKSGQEMALGKMQLWSRFGRKTSEAPRSYWIRLVETITSMARSGITMPPELHFSKSMPSVKLSSTQLSTLLSALESKGVTSDMQELRRISIKLFESAFLEAAGDILNIHTNLGDEEAVEGAVQDHEAEDEYELIEEFLSPEGGIFEERRAKAPKKTCSWWI